MAFESVFSVKRPGSGNEQLRSKFQLSILGFIFFMCSGMLYVAQGLGIPDTIPPRTQINPLLAHAITFSIGPLFAGVIINALGPRLSLFLGGLGYPFYILSYLIVQNYPEMYSFIVPAEAIRGFCAGIFWTAGGSVILAYPTENRKGLVIGVFWALFYLGPLVGGILALSATLNGSLYIVENETYAGFIILTLVGASSALVMVNPAQVVRMDGTNVAVPRQSWKTSFYSFWATLKTDPMVLLLLPMFFASSYFHQWQETNYNRLLFTGRTSTFNTFLFAGAQMIGSVFFGYCILDRIQCSRRTRAFVGWTIVVVMVFVVHIWAYLIQRSLPENYYYSNVFTIDFTHPQYTAHASFYVFCGFMDAAWNTLTYWLLGAISNDLSKLAIFVGFYRGLKTAGSAASLQSQVIYFPSFAKVLILSWTLCVVGVAVALPMIHYRINESSEFDDQQFEAKCGTYDAAKYTRLPSRSDRTLLHPALGRC